MSVPHCSKYFNVVNTNLHYTPNVNTISHYLAISTPRLHDISLDHHDICAITLRLLILSSLIVWKSALHYSLSCHPLACDCGKLVPTDTGTLR